MTDNPTCPYCGSIATSTIKWCLHSQTYDYECGTEGLPGEFVRTEACKDRQLSTLTAENERLKRCYESATGKPVCGEGAVLRVECKKMTTLTALLAEVMPMIEDVRNILKEIAEAEVPRHCVDIAWSRMRALDSILPRLLEVVEKENNNA